MNSKKSSPLSPQNPNENNFHLKCLKQEIMQMRELNKKLIDQNSKLEDENSLLKQKARVTEILLNNSGTDKTLSGELKFYSAYHNGFIDLKDNMYIKYSLEIKELKQKYENELSSLAISFSKQIEDLEETVSNLSHQLINLESEKKYHGQKFIEIFEKAKRRNQELKTDNKSLNKKLSKVEEKYGSLLTEYNEILKEKMELESSVANFEKNQEEHLTKIKDLSKKLYKVEADEDLIQLDPYELHRKIRYYETQLDYKDKEYIRIRKDYKEIKDYLDILGITKKDLRLS
jgi:chromosome segregation ATPase